MTALKSTSGQCVAGVYAPAFVERERGNVSERENPYVSPAGLR